MILNPTFTNENKLVDKIILENEKITEYEIKLKSKIVKEIDYLNINTKNKTELKTVLEWYFDNEYNENIESWITLNQENKLNQIKKNYNKQSSNTKYDFLNENDLIWLKDYVKTFIYDTIKFREWFSKNIGDLSSELGNLSDSLNGLETGTSIDFIKGLGDTAIFAISQFTKIVGHKSDILIKSAKTMLEVLEGKTYLNKFEDVINLMRDILVSFEWYNKFSITYGVLRIALEKVDSSWKDMLKKAEYEFNKNRYTARIYAWYH
ncbi:hypothetical protein [Mycoplasma leonicaptivi]|uniref:hypothetical protein n=1 Tax=Mycoplasma leonicaptivi TaxID=36742 RepID=UPI00047F615D|nr:hypothetical protein [Mycoplasma leonicaptivi]